MKVNIICPFYNEELILDKALEIMLHNLNLLPHEWKLIIVNDGSTDGSLSIAEKYERSEPRLKLLSYTINKGRGYAIRSGINSSDGDLIITTEIDLSWGMDIIDRIIRKFETNKFIDVVVASPNLPQGGYKNVPLKRVLISKIGNYIIRMLFTKSITMSTGMTRGYNGNVIRSIILTENGKEFHLETLLKLILLGYKIDEIPATLEWKDNKLSGNNTIKRKSKFKTKKLIISHLNFAIFANPIRYFVFFSAISFTCSILVMVLLLLGRINDQLTLESILLAVILFFFGINFFGFGVLSTQNISLLKRSWIKK